MEGWAAAALRPVATLLQPLQTVHWSDSHPTGRDLEAALAAAVSAASHAAAARSQILKGLPPPKPANPAIRQPAVAATAAPPAAAPVGPVGVHALNRFCWDTATRPHAAEAAELAARAALPPGTDMTAEDVAAAKAAAARAAEAAVSHALLLSTLPVWFMPGETGTCSATLQAAAGLMPMPAYGLSLELLDDDAATTATTDDGSSSSSGGGVLESLPALAAHCVQQLFAVQQAGPYVLVGCGVFSCMLAAAMASELEHQLQQQHVVLVLLDGPPALPTSCVLPDPLLYGLYQLLRDAGMLPVDGSGRLQPFSAFAVDVSAQVEAALAATADGGNAPPDSSSGTLLLLNSMVPGDQEDAVDAAVMQMIASAGVTQLQSDSVHRMLHTCRLVRRLCGWCPEFVYQVPAVLLLTEDTPGQAFLEVVRER